MGAEDLPPVPSTHGGTDMAREDVVITEAGQAWHETTVRQGVPLHLRLRDHTFLSVMHIAKRRMG